MASLRFEYVKDAVAIGDWPAPMAWSSWAHSFCVVLNQAINVGRVCDFAVAVGSVQVPRGRACTAFVFCVLVWSAKDVATFSGKRTMEVCFAPSSRTIPAGSTSVVKTNCGQVGKLQIRHRQPCDCCVSVCHRIDLILCHKDNVGAVGRVGKGSPRNGHELMSRLRNIGFTRGEAKCGQR